MSKVTEPMLLDKTGQQLLGAMTKQNELLTAIASGYNYKPTSIADVFAVVQSGKANQVFNYGDQIILPWTDKATGKTYECPLDVVHFGDVTLADGETVPGMLVQWHYATPFGVQFNQFQAFKYCEEQLPAGTYNVIIGDTWGNNCVKGKTYQFTLTKPVPAKGQLAGLYRAPDVSPSEWKVYSFESNTARRRKLRKLVRKAKRGEITKAKVDDCYQAWRSHASKGNSFHLIRRMDKFYKSLWNDQETEVTDNEN